MWGNIYLAVYMLSYHSPGLFGPFSLGLKFEVRSGVRSVPGFSECCPTTLHLHTDCRVCQMSVSFIQDLWNADSPVSDIFTALQNPWQRTAAAQVPQDLPATQRLIHFTAGKSLHLVNSQLPLFISQVHILSTEPGMQWPDCRFSPLCLFGLISLPLV